MIFRRSSSSVRQLSGKRSAPLRDRMEIIESRPIPKSRFHIDQKFLMPKQVENHGLDPEKIHFTDDAIRGIIKDYTREAGVRQLERLFGSIVRQAIKEILVGKIGSCGGGILRT
jgi:ATP-dependent Lon protease